MQSAYYVALDIHKETTRHCVKDVSGSLHAEGSIHATHPDLDPWMKTLPQPWTAAMEATVFACGIYDHPRPHAAPLKVAYPQMLRAIATAKKKNDRIDAKKICGCLLCGFLPECYIAPTTIHERRRTLRYRNLLLRSLERDPLLAERVERLMSLPAVGPVTALTWALEVGDVERFSSIKRAISFCGLYGPDRRSAVFVFIGGRSLGPQNLGTALPTQ